MPQTEAAPHPYTFPAGSQNGQLPDDAVQYLVAVRRHLHRYPESGYNEFATSRLVRTHLEHHGLAVMGPIAKTGLYVDIKGDHPGPHIGYRCDMDGLRLQDGKQVPYASRNDGVTHACGHDAHTAMGIGVALVLNRMRHALKGSVRVIFQPNEEGDPSGSRPLIEAGICDPLQALYCIHVDPALNTGQFGIPSGQVTASSDRIMVRVLAPTTGHSARPHQVRDTVWIATQLLNQYYQYVGRITDARSAAVLAVCRIEGGTAHNVIPSTVWFEGTLRSLEEESRQTLLNCMERAAAQFADLHDVRIEFVRVGALPAVVNDPRLCANVRSTAHELFGKGSTVELCEPSMGSEDFANYLEHVPGMLIRVGTGGSTETRYPLHDSLFDLDERALGPTVQLVTRFLIRHLETSVLG